MLHNEIECILLNCLAGIGLSELGELLFSVTTCQAYTFTSKTFAFFMQNDPHERETA